MDSCELSLLMGADASLTPPTTFLNCYRVVWWYRNPPGQHVSEKKNGGPPEGSGAFSFWQDRAKEIKEVT